MLVAQTGFKPRTYHLPNLHGTNDHLFNKCWSLKLNWNLEPFIYQTYIVNTTIFSPNVGGLDRIQTWNLSFTKLTYYILLIFILVIVLLSTTGSVRNLHTLKHIGVETRQAIPHFWLGLCNKWGRFSLEFELQSLSEGFWRRIWDCMKQSQLTWVREGIKK